jgi:Raf kinase inhibitor-like YbhB/YbcL family protein
MAPNIWSGRIVGGVLLAALLSIGTACALQADGQSDIAGSASLPALHISSTSFNDGDSIPQKLTCDGPNMSPNLQWPSPPAGTKSFAIVMDDSDAPTVFTHWLAYNIPPGTRDVPEGASTPDKRFEHAAEGINGFGKIGYGGPCPPVGPPHHYVFHVYALDVNPALPSGQTRDQLAATVRGHVLAEGRMTGLYGR